ncbi:DMT family transporter [Nemorincola caseinilytica]|uniref:DMT family transporter n=1 Tax=Nemorincola caseinilytica TaxID=2054315 RepID=A0ABP8N1U7_9BACT
MKKALVQMHLAVLLWGFTGILGRAISLEAPMLVWYRMLLTGLFMAAILTFRRQWVPIERRDMRRLALVGILMGLHWVAFYASIKLANVSIALVCLSTASIFTPLFDPIMNKGKHDMKELLLGSLAIIGVYLIYRFQQFYGWGILAGVIAALLSSVFTILNKQIASKYPARTMVFYEMSTGWGFITLLLPLLFWYQPDTVYLPQVSSTLWYVNDWIWLVVLSLCCTVWAQSLALNALKKLSSFTATLSVNLEPVYGILLAFIFYNENREIIFLDGSHTLNMGFIIGMSLILLSVVLQMLRLLRPGLPAADNIRERGGIES